MEELQDAIEDAQYMNAMHDGIPRPTKAWKKVSPEEVQQYVKTVQQNNPKALDLDTVCEGSLGFYYFIKFVHENDSVQYGNFLQDVSIFRVSLVTICK